MRQVRRGVKPAAAFGLYAVPDYRLTPWRLHPEIKLVMTPDDG